MLGRVFANVYESLSTVAPSTVNSATCRRKPVILLARLPSAIRLLERPRDGSDRRGCGGTTGMRSVTASSGAGSVTGSGRAAGQGAGVGRRGGAGRAGAAPWWRGGPGKGRPTRGCPGHRGVGPAGPAAGPAGGGRGGVGP